MTTAIAASKKIWWEQLVRKQKSIADLLPRGVDADRFVKSAYFALTRTPRLFECEPGTVFSGILKAAEAGLDLSGTSGEAYLIPFKDGKSGKLNAQFLIGYRGLLKLAHRSGKLLDVECRVVYDADFFEVRFGLDRKLNHVPELLPDDKAAPIGAYCVARFAGGGVTVEWMGTREINRIRERSRAKNDGPWASDWAEMAKKTVARRASKYWPGLDEMQHALAAEEEDVAPTRGLAITIPETATVETSGVGEDLPPKLNEKAAPSNIASEDAEPPREDAGPVDFPPPDDDVGGLFMGEDEAPPPASRTAEVKDRIKKGRS